MSIKETALLVLVIVSCILLGFCIAYIADRQYTVFCSDFFYSGGIGMGKIETLK